MKRVASLYLPHWSIDRVRRAEPPVVLPQRPDHASPDWLAIKAGADAEQGGKACDSPRNTGWRPGARWARADVDARIAALPAHQRPPMRELGRRSEAAEMPFKRLPGDDGGKSSGWVAPIEATGREAIDRPSPFDGMDPNADDRAIAAIARWNRVTAIRYPGEGPRPDKPARRGSNDPHAAPPGVAAFFDTARTTAGALARVCPDGTEGMTAPTRDRGDDRLFVTVARSGGRIEIAAVSPAAAALGIEPGMALTQARASVPELDVRDADPAGDRADLERLAITLARHWCPVVAIADAQSLFLDLTGAAHLHGGEAAMARRIVRLLARLGIVARVGVADTPGAAWALAHFLCRPRPSAACKAGAQDELRPKAESGDPSPALAANGPDRQRIAMGPRFRGDDILISASEHLPALAPLPVAALRLEDAAVERLRRLGVDTIGDLLVMPRAPLVRRFGPAIARRIDQATGAVPEPLDPVAVPTRIVVARRFAEPIATAEAIGHWLGGLVADLVRALTEAGQGARALLFAVERVDASVQTIRIGLARPTRDAAHILRLIVRRIEEIDPGYGIDALSLHVRRADPLGPEAIGVTMDETAPPDLAPLIDTLANRIGPARLWRNRPVESDVPERAVASVAPLDAASRQAPALRADDVRHLDARAADHPWHPRWTRPVRLLSRPERIAHVLAELPDFPPLRFTWRGTTHRIVRGDGPERITGEWWKRGAERHAVRDYFRVEDERGHRFWLFRRGDGRRAETGDLSWYMHGTFG